MAPKKKNTHGTSQPLPDPKPFVYKAAVRPDSVYRWVVLMLVVAAIIGFAMAQMLVIQRQDQLIADTASRVQLQGENRSRLVQEWLKNISRAGDAIASAELVQAFVTDPQMTGNPEAAAAAQAQKPYLSQMLKEFSARNKLEGAHILNAKGEVLLSEGVVPESMASNREIMKSVLKGSPALLPLHDGKAGVELDIVRPIRPLGEDEGPAMGALWYTTKVADSFTTLLAPSPLDRQGERTALIQPDPTSGDVYIVGKDAMGSLGQTMGDVLDALGRGHALSLSMVDGRATFATLVKVADAPFSILQEYKAADALAVMALFKPGIYTIVILMVGTLGGALAALTLHLLSQRNKTRVRLLGQTMDAMVRVVEARDPHLAGHHQRVARLAVAVGNILGMSIPDRATLYYCGLLSSVGRIFIPRDMLAKNKTLTKAERTDLEAHITGAMAVLDEMDLDLPVAKVIQQMYEREDGKGYPMGLRASQILPQAKVLAACDAFVALTSNRAHRGAMATEDALNILHSQSFNKAVVQAIEKTLK